jgi:glycerol-3-phosphate cytidylyltransferase
MDKKYKVGYTAGVYDLFHAGHLNLLKRAKEQCEYLIVAVSTDELVMKYKNKVPIIPYEDRKVIVESIKYVDKVVPQINRDKFAAFEKYQFDVMFVGDDWKGSDVFEKVDKLMRESGGCVEYLPYTQNVSSTLLRDVLNKIYSGEKENVHI